MFVLGDELDVAARCLPEVEAVGKKFQFVDLIESFKIVGDGVDTADSVLHNAAGSQPQSEVNSLRLENRAQGVGALSLDQLGRLVGATGNDEGVCWALDPLEKGRFVFRQRFVAGVQDLRVSFHVVGSRVADVLMGEGKC